MNSNPLQSAKESARLIIGEAIARAVGSGSLPAAELPEFSIEVPNDPANGDISSNAALVSAKALRMSPRAIAEKIIENVDLNGSVFGTVSAAGPGFINFSYSGEYYKKVMTDVLSDGESY